MKRIAGVLVLAALFGGCQKEEATPETVVDKITNGVAKTVGGPVCVSTYYDNGGSDYGCKGDPCDCMECPSVANADLAAINAVFTAVQGGDPVTISNTFHQYRSVLLTYVLEGDVDSVINGNASARSRGSNSAQLRYLIIRKGTTQHVYMLL